MRANVVLGFEEPTLDTFLNLGALGIGIILQIVIEGARSDMAIYAIFALAAWLGSTFIREEEENTDDSSEYDVFNLSR